MARKLGLVTGLALIFALICGPAGAASTKSPQQFSGKASYYDKSYRGIVTAGGEYDPKKFTCAHLTLPFGTRLRVTDKKTNRSVECTVNDRGPHSRHLILDLSWAAALKLDMIKRGVINVIVEVLPGKQHVKK
jgi:rare lipoprotein A